MRRIFKAGCVKEEYEVSLRVVCANRAEVAVTCNVLLTVKQRAVAGPELQKGLASECAAMWVRANHLHTPVCRKALRK